VPETTAESEAKQLASCIVREIKKSGAAFDYPITCDNLSLSADIRPAVAVEVYKSVATRAWADGIITKDESQTLKWLASRLDMSKEDALSILNSLKPSIS
jgi:hypothetical protein